MKKIYKSLFVMAVLLGVFSFFNKSTAQCVDGSTPNSVAYDTTIYFGTGITSTQIKFPKFDPEDGMLRCVKLIITMTGVIDTVAMQNYSTSPQTANFYYSRSDQMTGPGLTPMLTNNFNRNYGGYSLSARDANPSGGTDFVAIPHDTVLRQVMVRTLTDSTEISQFYGQDSATYNYDISVTTTATITGGNSGSLVLTSALVNFRFEYCVCPKVSLPVGLRNFTVAKTAAHTAELKWDAETDESNFVYDVEVSRDGKHFTRTDIVNKKYSANPSYNYTFSLKNKDYGRYYFRVRQRWLNGYVRYTSIKPVDFVDPFFATISLYPNPSAGAVGIKFLNVKEGKMHVEVANAQGQQIMQKEINVSGTDYKHIGQLTAGMYWVKITDVNSKATVTNKIIVQ